jgi:hypothetical protein
LAQSVCSFGTLTIVQGPLAMYSSSLASASTKTGSGTGSVESPATTADSPTMCAPRTHRDGRSTSILPLSLRRRFSDQDEMCTFTSALPEDRQVFVQEVDLVCEYLLAHGISIEIEVVARVTTQLPARRPLGYLP